MQQTITTLMFRYECNTVHRKNTLILTKHHNFWCLDMHAMQRTERNTLILHSPYQAQWVLGSRSAHLKLSCCTGPSHASQDPEMVVLNKETNDVKISLSSTDFQCTSNSGSVAENSMKAALRYMWPAMAKQGTSRMQHSTNFRA